MGRDVGKETRGRTGAEGVLDTDFAKRRQTEAKSKQNLFLYEPVKVDMTSWIPFL